MRILNLYFLGDFGNQLFQYAFARAFCERYDLELHTDPWLGERVFAISHPRCGSDLPRRDENTLQPEEVNVSYRSYSQQQKCLNLYNLTAVRKWFTLRTEVEEALNLIPMIRGMRIFHLRRGDYAGYGYALVSEGAYLKGAVKHDFDPRTFEFVSLENVTARPSGSFSGELFTGELSMIPDFYRMMRASVLFRSNSTFAWWAATLSQAKVFSPVIEGMLGGIEHDCAFVKGNWPRLHNLDFTTDLHLSP